MTRRTTLIAAVVACVTAAPIAEEQDLVYRASTETVTVDVSVRRQGRVVGDLGIDDFEVHDSGLPQRITALSRETLPIDVICIVDLSGSVQGEVLTALTRAVNAVGAQLRPTDRARVITFNQQIREVRALEPGGWPEGLSLGRPGSLTSLLDAVAVSLIAPAEVGRRRMAIVFTDGLDTTSFVDGTHVIEIARRSNMAVFTVALAEGTARRPRRLAHEVLFRTLAETTGGVLDVVQRDEDLSASFAQAFDEFRTSYVLAYSYEGPPRPGWHPIGVTIRRPGDFEVRARQGYVSTAP